MTRIRAHVCVPAPLSLFETVLDVGRVEGSPDTFVIGIDHDAALGRILLDEEDTRALHAELGRVLGCRRTRRRVSSRRSRRG